jgi:ribosomal protein S18 acetylase RimI-like enzyme
MIFRFEEINDYNFLKKNNLEKINKKSQKYKNYKMNLADSKIKFAKKYANNINLKFLTRICNDRLNKFVFYGMSSQINLNELASIIIYRKVYSDSKKQRFIIMIIAVHPELRDKGYGSLTMDDFFNYLRKKNKKIEIILHSIKSSINFYLNIGFNIITNNKFIEKYEGEDINEDDKILKYVIC